LLCLIVGRGARFAVPYSWHRARFVVVPSSGAQSDICCVWQSEQREVCCAWLWGVERGLLCVTVKHRARFATRPICQISRA